MLEQTAETFPVREIGKLPFENNGQLVLAFLELFVADSKYNAFRNGVDALCCSTSVVEVILGEEALTTIPKEKMSDGLWT